MMKYNVEIPEIHKAIVEVELENGATRQDILNAAVTKFESGEDFECEYSRTDDNQDNWTVRNQKGDFIA